MWHAEGQMNPSTPHFPLQLAPMVGLSHAVLRQIILGYLPKHVVTDWPTEMLNSRRIPNEILGATSETLVLPHEENMFPQILGNEAEPIQRSIEKLAGLWKLRGIDINMGCPVQKALKHNYGVALMGDVGYASEVVRIAKRSTVAMKIKLSVKLRATDEKKDNLQTRDFVRHLIDAGADRIILHPRTAAQQRRGQADWEQIRILVDEFAKSGVEIVGNGDIQTVDDVHRMMRETGVKTVMSGRALTARPWLVWQLAEDLGLLQESSQMEPGGSELTGETGKNLNKAPRDELSEGAEYGRMLQKFIEFTQQTFCEGIGMSENLALRKIQFFVRTNHVWLEFGHHLMSRVNSAKSLSEMNESVQHFFSVEQRMLPKTDLRQ